MKKKIFWIIWGTIVILELLTAAYVLGWGNGWQIGFREGVTFLTN